MGWIQKRQKPIEDVDRLSHLPQGLIIQILSFLPTKYAVQTSILSRKWKHQWRSITNLDFNDSLHPRPQHWWKSFVQTSFMNFVYRVLLLLKCSHLHQFSLDCVYDYDTSHINAWVSAAISRYVQEIDIYVRLRKTGFLPCDLFTCRTLVVLKLYMKVVDVPTSVFLPNLEVLHFMGTEFKDGESTGRLLSSCPVLQDLALLSCVLDISVLNISAPLLKRLVLTCNDDKRIGLKKFRFELDAPQLEYLEFFGYVPGGNALKNLHSLVEARIDFYLEEYSSNSATENSVIEFAQGLSSVQSLYLSNHFTEVFSKPKSKFPEYLNLRKLEFGTCDISGCSLRQDLIESSPQLETLNLNFDYSVPLENIPMGIWNRLKTIQLHCFEGKSEDLRFVKYILMNAKVLERFGLRLMSREAHFNVTTKLLTFQRASSSCKVVIYTA